MHIEKKGKYSKKDLLALTDVLERFGDVIIDFGDIEKKIGPFNKFQKIFDGNIEELSSNFKKNPELATTLGVILIKFLSLSSLLEKFPELTPSNKIKSGKNIKEISVLLKEIIEKV